jgi:serine/threonine protein phosphatase PrpC
MIASGLETMPWLTALAVDSYRRESEDRALIVELSFGPLLLVADGVGGRSGGGAAAEFVREAVERFGRSWTTPPGELEIAAFLRRLDTEMSRIAEIGETTGVAAVLAESTVAGAAVGDSVAWWIEPDTHVDLTRHASMKPWLGSGAAHPRPFAIPALSAGTLLLATDGLTKYADAGTLCAIARRDNLGAAARELIEAVRPPSRRLPDDVVVILARPV